MSDLTHLFSINQKVICNTETGFEPGIVKEIYKDHIIVDIPSICDHMWYEEGFNLNKVYPDYNFIGGRI